MRALDQSAFFFLRFLVPGDRSIMTAMIMTTIWKVPQVPEYTFSTTEYHNSVVGAKKNPINGHRIDPKTPENQFVRNHR